MDKITYRELVAAMRKNGYRKVRGSYFKYKRVGQRATWDSSTLYDDDTKLYGACALGQVALNLHVQPHLITDAMNDGMRNYIFHLNDRTGKTVPEIADAVEERYSNLMDQEISW